VARLDPISSQEHKRLPRDNPKYKDAPIFLPNCNHSSDKIMNWSPWFNPFRSQIPLASCKCSYAILFAMVRAMAVAVAVAMGCTPMPFWFSCSVFRFTCAPFSCDTRPNAAFRSGHSFRKNHGAALRRNLNSVQYVSFQSDGSFNPNICCRPRWTTRAQNSSKKAV
jgi:hypothetical protein